MNRKFQKECESSCEYILPDYLGDVRKILHTSARTVPSGQFDSDGSCELAGVVAYELVYLDAENKICSASFTSDYDLSFPVDSECCRCSYVTSSVSSYSIRLTGPRRAVAKANVLSDINVMEANVPAMLQNSEDGGEKIEKLIKTAVFESVYASERVEREYADEMTALDEPSDDIEIITSSAVVKISDSVPVDGGVNIKGTLIVTAIVKTPELSVFAVKKEIPFDETVSIDFPEGSTSAIADAAVTSITCAVTDFEGTSKINANAIVDFKALCLSNESRELILDAYHKSRDYETKYENLSYKEHLFSSVGAASAAAKIARADVGCENVKEILTLTCDFKSPAIQKTASGIEITADTAVSGIACEINEDGDLTLFPIKLLVPMVFNANLSCRIGENTDISVRLIPGGVDWDVDTEYLNIKCDATLVLNVSENRSERVLSVFNAVGEEEYERSASKISVYFPDKSETLFEIAKKFKRGAAELARDNEISQSVSEGGVPFELSRGYQKLIIR